MQELIIACFLFVMAYEDFNKGEVRDIWYVFLMFFIKNWLLPLILLTISLLTFKYIEKYIGGADIKISLVILGVYNPAWTLSWISLSLVLGLLYALISKKKLIRMFPFFLFAYILKVYVL